MKNLDNWLICIYVSIALLGFSGWVMNIVSLIDSNGLGGLEAARIVGIFVAPLGAVLGYF